MKNTSFLLKITIMTWFFFCGYMLYMLFWPITPYKYNKYPLPILTPTVHMGGVVTYVRDYCKSVKGPADVTHSFQKKLTTQEMKDHITDVTVILDTYHNTNTPMGCHVVYNDIKVPNIKRGTYRIIQTIHGKINPFRVSNEEYYTEWFTVI